ncbi:RNF4 ligase, partial [Xiphorhynchus elegans]|nr:RNF4 ligase [Xiphorhynchus elegans]
RKRCGDAGDSRPARKRRRLLDSSAGGASQAEPIDSIQSGMLSFELVIDLTGESSGPEVRDLTDDLVLHQEQSQQHPLVSGAADNPVVLLMTDDEEEPGDNDGYVTDKIPRMCTDINVLSGSVLSRACPAGTIRCPICMDFYSEIVQSERLIVSTPCGHVFCSQCLPVALETTSTCPTCRTELTHSQYHPIYI